MTNSPATASGQREASETTGARCTLHAARQVMEEEEGNAIAEEKARQAEELSVEAEDALWSSML